MKLKYNQFNSRAYESHWLVESEIKPETRVLDIGCATGYFGERLKRKNCKVWGVEIDRNAAKIAKKYLEKVYTEDIRDISKLQLKKNFFDYILLLDVIEHINNTEVLLQNLKLYLAKDGKIIITTPNIAHISMRLSLLFGKFEYTDVGIMDKTHIHFFTKSSLINLLKELNFKIENIEYSSDFGQIPYIGRFFRRISKILQYYITQLFPTLIGVQFIIVCKVIK